MFIKQITKLWIAVMGILCVSGAFAQDPEFTQFYANPLYLNPALAGTKNCPRVTMNWRNQWPNLDANYITYSAGYDQKIDQLHGGIGISALYDEAGQGVLNTLRIGGTYSYHLKINRKLSMNFGLQADYMQKDLNWDKLKFGDMIDPRNGFIYTTQEKERGETVQQADFSMGMLVYSKKWFAGFAVNHLTQPNESFIGGQRAKLPLKFTLHGGANIPLSKEKKYSKPIVLSPNILIRHQGRIGKDFVGNDPNIQNVFAPSQYMQYLLGLYAKKGVIVAGLWYRLNDAVIVTLGIESKHFNFGYSYDLTASKIEVTSGGSHEISMAIKFPCKPKRRRFRAISCPSF